MKLWEDSPSPTPTPCPEERPSPASSTVLVVALVSARHDIEAPRSLPDQKNRTENGEAGCWGKTVRPRVPGDWQQVHLRSPEAATSQQLRVLTLGETAGAKTNRFLTKEAAAPPPAQPRRGTSSRASHTTESATDHQKMRILHQTKSGLWKFLGGKFKIYFRN